jgi:hypothetical protein
VDLAPFDPFEIEGDSHASTIHHPGGARRRVKSISQA